MHAFKRTNVVLLKVEVPRPLVCLQGERWKVVEPATHSAAVAASSEKPLPEFEDEAEAKPLEEGEQLTVCGNVARPTMQGNQSIISLLKGCN